MQNRSLHEDEPARRVAIDFHPRCGDSWHGRDAVVVVDVIRATTTAVTSVMMGRRCLSVASLESALQLSRSLRNPLLAGELHGRLPPGFDMDNSPSELASRTDIERPMVLLSSSGTRLLDKVRRAPAVYLGCFRNHRSLSRHLAAHHRSVAILGAGTRGEFREEDQMCCAWIAGALMRAGFVADGPETLPLVEEWAGAPPDAFLRSKSVAWLRESRKLRDLEFILSHFDDVCGALRLRGREVVGPVSASP